MNKKIMTANYNEQKFFVFNFTVVTISDIVCHYLEVNSFSNTILNFEFQEIEENFLI